jgi:hypothetical protein
MGAIPSFAESDRPLDGLGPVAPGLLWDSALGSPFQDEVWFSTPTNNAATAWLQVLDLQTGTVRRGARLAGPLRHVQSLRSGGAAVLASYALHQTDAAGVAQRVLRGVPKYLQSSMPFDGGRRLALTWVPLARPARSVPVIDVASWTLERRVGLPAADVVVDRPDGGYLVCSFRSGAARWLDDDLVVLRGQVRLPRAISPVTDGSRWWCLRVEEGIAANVHPPGPHGLRAIGVLAEVDLPSGDVIREQRVFDDPVQTYTVPRSEILGQDTRGNLIVVAPSDELVLVDVADLRAVARHRFGRPIANPVYVAPDRVYFMRALEFESRLGMVTWSKPPL